MANSGTIKNKEEIEEQIVVDDKFGGPPLMISGGGSKGIQGYEVEPGSIGKYQRLAPDQQAALFLAKGVGVVIVIISIVLLLDYFLNVITYPHPSIDSNDPLKNLDSLEKSIKIYNEQISLVEARLTRLFTSIIGAIFLPVFTSIVGYIFGYNRSSRRGD